MAASQPASPDLFVARLIQSDILPPVLPFVCLRARIANMPVHRAWMCIQRHPEHGQGARQDGGFAEVWE